MTTAAWTIVCCDLTTHVVTEIVLKAVGTSVMQYILAFAAVFAGAQAAYARADIRLHWMGAHECAKPTDFPTKVAALLTMGAHYVPLRVQTRAMVQRDASAKWLLHLTMAISDSDGRIRYEGARSVVLDSCEEVKEAVVLIVALIIDSTVRDQEQVVQAQPAEKKSAARIQLAKIPSRKSQAAFDIGAGMDFWIGPLPKVRPSAGLSVGFTMTRLFVDITTSFGFSQRQILPIDTSIGGDFQMLFGMTARACWVVQIWGAEIGPCTAMAGALIRGIGVNVLSPQTVYNFWVGILGGGTVALRIGGNWRVRMNAALGGALTASRFEIENVGLVHQNQIFTAQFASQLEFQFQ